MPKQPTTQLVDHLFRHEAGRMVAVLTRIFGMHNLDLAEDVVQEAFIKAVQTWTYNAIPDNPAGWLMQVAKRQAIDILRRDQRGKEVLDRHQVSAEYSVKVDDFFHENEIADSQLQLIFACCHPKLKPAEQIALTLKTASGFGIKEIARALMISQDAVKQRLLRARNFVKKQNIQLSIPVGNELTPRLSAVNTVLYLLFNEGYSSVKGDEVIRRDLCIEAMRLTRILTEHKMGGHSSTCALLALMCFQAARFEARLDMDDQIILLPHQDRSLWDAELLHVGRLYMGRAFRSGPTTVYHLEAAIAAQHIGARSFEETDWPRLAKLYEVLYEVKPTPVVKLNYLVVLLRLGNLEAAAVMIDELIEAPELSSNHLLHAVISEFHQLNNNTREAIYHIIKAIDLARTQAEIKMLVARLKSLSEVGSRLN
jgi:RNA polymerase sigma factor (sigma-70 family)